MSKICYNIFKKHSNVLKDKSNFAKLCHEHVNMIISVANLSLEIKLLSNYKIR